MFVLLSLVVCLSAQPHVCEVVTPDYVQAETSAPVSFFECLGFVGQDVARRWLEEHAEYRLKRIQCSVGSDPERLRAQIQQPEA